MGLQPLEFSDCLTDSPYFREKLHTHEKELERTSKAIKGLINECKELLSAARSLSRAQRNFSKTLIDFKFDTQIGSEQTDDEIIIADSLKQFGQLISSIEDERDRMLDRANDVILRPLETFRKEQIGGAKDGKKKFDKQTSKFCQSLERYLNLKAKSNDVQLQEADAVVEMERRHFYQASMQYVLLLQEVQERKKFEFVETLLSCVYSWLTFYHQGHEVGEEVRPYMQDLQMRLQKSRCNYDTTKEEAETLMNKMLEVRGTKPQDHATHNRTCTKEGYLFMMEKKALGTTWTKYYCQYQKENKILTMIPYNQVTGKGITTDTVVLTSCTRRAADSIDKRFCFDITAQDRNASITLQSLSEDDRRTWLEAMDGKEPIYHEPTKNNELDNILLDDVGFGFIKKCIQSVEARGLKEQGPYRVVGVNSKVHKLINMGLDRRKADRVDLGDASEWELTTVTSALKNYFRSLPEPLMTYNLHEKFLVAAKKESKTLRVNDIHELVHQLPEPNFEMLELLIKHLRTVADHSDKNLMKVPNLGVCFGPTLMRPKQETMAAIMDIKFCNLVIEILIDNYEKIFKTAPDGVDIANSRVLNSKAAVISSSPRANNISKNAIPPASPSGEVTLRRQSSPNPTSRENNYTPATTPTPSGCSVNSVFSNPSAGVDSPQTYAQYRAKLRPTTGFYGQYAAVGDQHSSASSSTESLNSKCSHQSASSTSTSPYPYEIRKGSAPVSGHVQQSGRFPVNIIQLENSPRSARAINRFSHIQATSPPPASPRAEPGSNRRSKRKSTDSLTCSVSSSTSSVSSISSGQQPNMIRGRKVRTLYACEAENDMELSFEPNQIIYNVRSSREPGWLEGSLNGKTGLMPANYVEFLN